jgi:hypothetical protein
MVSTAIDRLAVQRPRVPAERGSYTEQLFTSWRLHPYELPQLGSPDDREDATLALYAMYELHYRGFAGVDDRWEWEPTLLRLRGELEVAFERELRETVDMPAVPARDVVDELRAIATGGGLSLSEWFCTNGTLRTMQEFAVHRSAYQLKEADPHTWAIPRLNGPAKAALVQIQHGEYGDGRAGSMHSELFANTLRALELDPTYGAYLDRIPAPTLATVNLVSMFGLHRRFRGALVGHLALFEMCSVVPMGRYAATVRRLGLPAAAPFFDAHVEADVEHASIALHEMAGALARAEPELAADIVFGARALDAVEAEFATSLVDAWSAGRSSLRPC